MGSWQFPDAVVFSEFFPERPFSAAGWARAVAEISNERILPFCQCVSEAEVHFGWGPGSRSPTVLAWRALVGRFGEAELATAGAVLSRHNPFVPPGWANDSVWIEYLTSVVDIDGWGTFGPATARGTRPTPGPTFIVTAENPLGVKRSVVENAARVRELRASLDEADISYVPAVGRNVESTWCEASVALLRVTRQTALRLGRQFQQNAIFALDGRGRLEVVVCEGAARG